jgi:Spy/CpxP family protein refolding chaperone
MKIDGEWIMKRTLKYVGGAAVLALCVATTPVEGQRGMGFRGVGPRGGGGPFMGQSVEKALENQEELGLSQDQISELQGLKSVLDGDVTPLMEEMKTLREGIQSGDVDRDEGFRRMQALRGELLTASAPIQGRVQEILTVQQHSRLQPLVRQDRPGLGRGVPGVQGQSVAPQGRGARSGIRGRMGSARGGVGIGARFNGRGRYPTMAPRSRFPRRGGALNRAPLLGRRGIGGQGGVPGQVQDTIF